MVIGDVMARKGAPGFSATHSGFFDSIERVELERLLLHLRLDFNNLTNKLAVRNRRTKYI